MKKNQNTKWNFKFSLGNLLFTLFLVNGLSFQEAKSQNVLKGPYLIEPGKTSLLIRWEMDKKSDYSVEYGLNTKKTKLIKLNYRGSKNNGNLYEAKLSDLRPNSVYYYRLVSPGNNKWFKTKTFLDNQEDMTFVAMGDSRSNPEIFAKIMSASGGANPDLIISMGDLVESGGEYEQWGDFYFPVVRGIAESKPIVSTLGDHEGDGDDGELFRYFLRTDQAVDKQWFSFDYGSAHFISLDYRHADSKEMIDWFIKDITSSSKKWNFVYMHRPCYNLGGHASAWGRETWPELFSKYNVDIVFAGHSHLYERFYPVRLKNDSNALPVTYITTGGAGAELYEAIKNESVLASSESVNHYIKVQIAGDTLKLQTTRMDGSTLDKLLIIKNKNGINKEYADQIIPRETLDLLTMFNSAITQSISSVPLYTIPIEYKLKLHSGTSEMIPFKVELADTTGMYYFAEPLSDTLKNNVDKEVTFKIFSRKDMTFSTWGELRPELRLKLTYDYNSRKETLVGGALSFWPE
jgi:predicted phosphodiesterase